MNIYIERDYRNIIKALMEEKRKTDPQASFQQLAEVISIPKSYVSKVMGGKADFSADQIYLCSKYFQLHEQQLIYLELLVDFERSAIKNRKQFIAKQIDQMRKPFLNTESNVGVVSSDELGADLTEYYLDVVNLLVHVGLAIDRYRLTLPLLYKELRLPHSSIQKSIENLEKLKIIVRQGDGYKINIDNIHLPVDNKFFPVWRNQMKLLTAASVFHTNPDSNRHFSAITKLTPEGRDLLVKSFFEFINSIKHRLVEGPDEDVYQINFDFIQWTDRQK